MHGYAFHTFPHAPSKLSAPLNPRQVFLLFRAKLRSTLLHLQSSTWSMVYSIKPTLCINYSNLFKLVGGGQELDCKVRRSGLVWGIGVDPGIFVWWQRLPVIQYRLRSSGPFWWFLNWSPNLSNWIDGWYRFHGHVGIKNEVEEAPHICFCLSQDYQCHCVTSL